jgi:hypothetical protein
LTARRSRGYLAKSILPVRGLLWGHEESVEARSWWKPMSQKRDLGHPMGVGGKR